MVSATGRRGPRPGGRLYPRPATEEITAGESLRALEGTIAPARYVEPAGSESRCQRVAACVAREFWLEWREQTDAFLERITLRDLCKRARRKEKAPPMRYI